MNLQNRFQLAIVLLVVLYCIQVALYYSFFNDKTCYLYLANLHQPSTVAIVFFLSDLTLASVSDFFTNVPLRTLLSYLYKESIIMLLLLIAFSLPLTILPDKRLIRLSIIHYLYKVEFFNQLSLMDKLIHLLSDEFAYLIF